MPLFAPNHIESGTGRLLSVDSQPFTAWAVLESDRVAMPKINRESLAELVVAVPPISEQQKIASAIATQLPKVDAVIRKVSASITLLKERRSALITAAVTGQIDLRGAASADTGT